MSGGGAKRVGRLILGLAMACGAIMLLSRADLLPGVAGRLFGPMVLALIFIWVVLTRKGDKPGQKALMLVALVLSFTADIVININFIYGIGVFLLMHLVYIVMFSRRGGWSWRMLTFAPLYVVVAAVVMLQIWPTVSGNAMLAVAVPVYVVVITLMATLAASAWSRDNSRLLAHAALGSLNFFISDACIAINEFAYPREFADLWILPTYWLAQYLISSSLPAKHKK